MFSLLEVPRLCLCLHIHLVLAWLWAWCLGCLGVWDVWVYEVFGNVACSCGQLLSDCKIGIWRKKEKPYLESEPKASSWNLGNRFQAQMAIKEHLNIICCLEFLVKAPLWKFYHKRGGWQGRMLEFLILSSNIVRLHHYPSCQVSIRKMVSEQPRYC